MYTYVYVCIYIYVWYPHPPVPRSVLFPLEQKPQDLGIIYIYVVQGSERTMQFHKLEDA